jgi:hypothetical protein
MGSISPTPPVRRKKGKTKPRERRTKTSSHPPSSRVKYNRCCHRSSSVGPSVWMLAKYEPRVRGWPAARTRRARKRWFDTSSVSSPNNVGRNYAYKRMFRHATSYMICARGGGELRRGGPRAQNAPCCETLRSRLGCSLRSLDARPDSYVRGIAQRQACFCFCRYLLMVGACVLGRRQSRSAPWRSRLRPRRSRRRTL